MKKIIFFALASALVACNVKDKKATDSIENIASHEIEKEINTGLYGSWVGDFIVAKQKDPSEYHTDNKISIVIKKITSEQVIGQSIVAGNSRLLTGTLSGNKFTLKEPGDHKYDGVFEFEFRNDSLIGNWTAFNTNIAVPKRSFGLTKKQFIYDPKLMLPKEGDYIDWYNPKQKEQEIEGETYSEEYYRQASDEITQLNASTQKLTEPILKNLKKLDLEIIRNTIYARHGYTFKKKSIRQFFDPVSWYMPVSDNVDNELTPLEKDNIALLKRFEKYAEDNYDTFGR